MTRVLSELLGAREPLFSQGLRQLEALSGHPQADIRLSARLRQEIGQKIHELGLDRTDTKGQELYAALGQRLHDDEKHFVSSLRKDDSRTPLTAVIAQAVVGQLDSRLVYAIKPAVGRRLLKANLPKKTMKLLSYRSIDSMLKHESVASLLAAATLVETAAWNKRLYAAYGKLRAVDFESRAIAVEHPTSNRWVVLAETVVPAHRQLVVTFKEFGAVVLLPVPEQGPDLPALTIAALALQACNEVRAAGTFLKLQQMQSDFGAIVQQIAHNEPMLPAETIDQPVSWHSLHQYFARFESSIRTTMFEPVVAAEELAWSSIERSLARIAPGLGFWEETAYLALLDVDNGSRLPVSMNLLDQLISHGNGLPFEQRVVQYFRQSLKTELLLNYLNHDKLEQTFFNGVHGKLAPEMAT